MNFNVSNEIWGPDAAIFNPDRHLRHDPYEKTEGAAKRVPGVWRNQLSFLGGPRNCIGYRFALAEMKALLFVLGRSFAFEELPSHPIIEQKAA